MIKSAPIVGLDIGTTKVCCVVGEVNSKGGVDITGVGRYPSHGLRKGVVVNIKTTVESIKMAVEEAEMMAGIEVQSVYVGIAGGHIKGINSKGVIAVKNKEINQRDVDRVIDAAMANAVSMDREVIHVLPQEFIVDNLDGIKSPLEMSGSKLEVKVHIVTGAVTSAQNIVTCVNRAGLEVSDIVLQPLASGEAVLTDEEKEVGVAMIDIGGGTSDTVIFAKNAIQYTSVLGVGGDQLTNDIAMGLKTSVSNAGKIKHDHGCAISKLIKEPEFIEIPGIGGRNPRIVTQKSLSDIIEPRVAELFNLLKVELEPAVYDRELSSGVVLTGGAVIMGGMLEVAENAFQLPVRLGCPKGFGGLVDVVDSPMYSTGVGLVLYGLQDRGKTNQDSKSLSGRNLFNKTLNRMKGWVEEYF